MPKAYSYLRFSTPEQMRGDSIRRQAQLAQDYALRHGLVLDDSLTFHDLDVSAYYGRNAEVRRLADFLKAVRAGLVEKGSYLLVESLDRISRQAARRALRVLEDLCEAGITVVTLVDGREYTAASLADPLSLMVSLLTFIRANEESAMKSRRLKAAWEDKRAQLVIKPMTSICPPWLRLNKKAGKFIVIEERAAVVRRIFEDTLKGHGQHRIAESLNQEGVRTFGSSKFWRRTYIKTILANAAVIGTLTPKVSERVGGKRTRVSLDPVPDYFPSVVDPETYQRVQVMKVSTRSPLRGRHAGGTVRNIFGGLLTCGYCGSTAVLVVKGIRYLVCERAKSGAGCRYRSVRYERIEAAFLLDAKRVLSTAPAGQSGEAFGEELDSVDANLDGIDDALERLLDEYQRGRARSVTERIRKLETERDRLKQRRRDLLEKQAITIGPMVQRRIDDLDKALSTQPIEREAVNALMRQVFASVEIDHDNGVLNLRFKHGGESQVIFG